MDEGEAHERKSEDDSLNDELSLNDPDDAEKNLARFAEIDSASLHGEISEFLGKEYLSVLTPEEDTTTTDGKQWTGKIIAPNHRFLVDLPCRRETPCPPGVNMADLELPPFLHVFFVVDTSSPHSYLSVEAMQAISASKKDYPLPSDFSTAAIPDFVDVEFRSGAKVEFHLSPGSNSEVNILGGSVLQVADVMTNTKDKEFVLKFVEE